MERWLWRCGNDSGEMDPWWKIEWWSGYGSRRMVAVEVGEGNVEINSPVSVLLPALKRPLSKLISHLPSFLSSLPFLLWLFLSSFVWPQPPLGDGGDGRWYRLVEMEKYPGPLAVCPMVPSGRLIISLSLSP